MPFTKIASTWGIGGWGGDQLETEFHFGDTKFEAP